LERSRLTVAQRLGPIEPRRARVGVLDRAIERIVVDPWSLRLAEVPKGPRALALVARVALAETVERRAERPLLERPHDPVLDAGRVPRPRERVCTVAPDRALRIRQIG